jgi:hypothetical protein
MVNFYIRSEELSSEFPAYLNPICRDLISSRLPFWNGVFVVVDWRRHSSEKSRRIHFRCDETGVLRRALGEFTVEELALIKFRAPEVASKERTMPERDMTKASSSEDAVVESAVLEC